ncbi:MAG: hypothetical protein ACLQBQ_06025 [Smithella sp.]
MVSGAYAGSVVPTVGVSATVQAVCNNPTNGSFSALSIDPSTTNALNFAVSTSPTVTCTKGRTTPSITASSEYGMTSSSPATCTGALLTGFTMKESGGNTINYSFQCPANVTGTGFGTGQAVTLPIVAQVAVADANSAVYTGTTYQDTITLTVNY